MDDYEDFFQNPEITDTAQLSNWDAGTPYQDWGYADFFQNPAITNTEQLPNWDAGAPDQAGNPWYAPVASFLGSVPNNVWGSLGAAGLGYLSDQRANNRPTTSSTTQQLPAWWEGAAQGGLLASQFLPQYESQLNTPGTLVRNTDLTQYMNPYLDAALNPVLRNMDIEEAVEQNRLKANAAKLGAFGGSRPALDQSLALERQGRRRDEAISGAYRSAYDTATGLAGDDIGRQWADIAKVHASPYEQVGALQDMLNATRTSGGSIQTSSAPYRDPLQGALTTGATVMGLLGKYNPSGNS